MMMSKVFVLILLGLIVIALFTGLYFLLKENSSRSKNTLRSLMVRVGFTLILLILLLVGIYMGWLNPHPVGQ